MTNNIKTDIVIIGCGVSGLYCALCLPKDKKITVITKSKAEESDSYLAQGGICVLKDSSDYDSFYEDTMRAGHYENTPESVDIMIRSSKEVINTLTDLGVNFNKNGNDFEYTREGAHSTPRILFHKDETGKEITSKLLNAVKAKDNITLIEHCTMVDIVKENNTCHGIIYKDNEDYGYIAADYTILATGGIGGLFEHSTNWRHLTGDALAIALKHNINIKNINYIQIHPTSFYKEGNERKFLISESVRGEGGILLNNKGERFVDELLPRDVVTKAILSEMKKTNAPHVWLSLEKISESEIKSHFPNIYKHCLEEGYDITKESIPVVPSQHYFMGGIEVDSNSKTMTEHLYAVGETACNGVHGKNRLASNSLLESLVFAKRAAEHITENYEKNILIDNIIIDEENYKNYAENYKNAVLAAIEKEQKLNG